jgi:chorismate-pyruvate lyase
MPGISQANIIIPAEASEMLDAWLYYNHPITDKLNNLTGDTQLEVLSQQWIQTTWWDKYFLNIVEHTLFQREIIMKSSGRTFWYARSIIPSSCYQLDPEFFKRLERESIRNLIFDEPKVVLSQRKIYPINAQCIEYYWVKKHLSILPEILWGRLAEFSFIEKNSFYLLELLFPQLEELG